MWGNGTYRGTILAFESRMQVVRKVHTLTYPTISNVNIWCVVVKSESGIKMINSVRQITTPILLHIVPIFIPISFLFFFTFPVVFPVFFYFSCEFFRFDYRFSWNSR